MNDNSSCYCECSRPKHPRAVSCDECKRIEEWRVRAESPRYAIVGALRDGDWCSGNDLRDRLEAGPGTDAHHQERLSSRLLRLVAEGVVEQRRMERPFRIEYRLAKAKRRAA